MATLALSLGGAVAGGLIGGPTGVQAGFLAGQFAGNVIFGNGDDRIAEGPRLTDLTVTSSTYGRPIPIIYGSFRLGGNVVWSPGIKELRQEQTQGGKGGGAAQTSVTFRYTADFRIALCEGPIQAVLRVWADGKLIVDFTGMAPVFGGKIRQAQMRVYLGGEAQQPDPAEQADRGIENAPAYRGQAGIVFENLPLEDFGNRIPQITAEIATAANETFPTASAATFATPITQLARWSHDRRFLYTLSTDGVATKWDVAERRQSVGKDIGVGEAFCPGLDRDGNLYSGNGFGKVVKYDDSWTQIGISPTAMTQNFANLIVAGQAGFERVIAQGLTGNIGIFSATTQKLLNELKLSDFAAPTAGTYRATLDRNGMAADAEGFVWTLVVDGAADGYLFKIDPGIGSVRERHVLTGKNGARYLSYDETTNSLIVEESGAAGLFRFSLDTLTIDASLAVVLNATVDNRTQYCNGPLGGRLWLQATTIAFEIDTASFTVLRIVSITSWPTIPPVQQMVYDALNNAHIWFDAFPSTLYWAYLDRQTGLTVTLGGIVDDVSSRVGLTPLGDLDTSALGGAVTGFAITDRMSARAALEPLASAYFFDAREEDFKVVMLARGGAPVVTIPESDLGARAFGDTGFVPLLGEERIQEIELPRRIDVTYADPSLDYQTNTQFFQRVREAVATRALKVIRLPLALSEAEAAQRVEKVGFQTWQARTPYDLRVSRKHARISAGDVISVTAKGATASLRVESLDYGADGVIRVRGVSEDAVVYDSSAAGVAGLGVPAQSIALAGPTAFFLMDTPLLRDAEEGLGIYAAAGALGTETWPGVSILKSANGEAFDAPFLFVPGTRNAVHGASETILPDHGARTWDRVNSLTLRLARGALVSVSEADVLNGANALLIGDEIIQFAGANLNADGSYTLDTLLRGRRGTEWAAGGHGLGERAVLLSDASLSRVNLPDTDVGAVRFYKGVTLGGPVSEGTQKTFTLIGRSLMPYAPVDIRGAQSGSPSDWTLTWQRRTRLGGAWKDAVDVPLGEESEAYEVDILNGPAVVRTITAVASSGGSLVTPSTRQAVYSGADQIADLGGEQASLSLRVYQMSATLGRGFPGSAVVAG